MRSLALAISARSWVASTRSSARASAVFEARAHDAIDEALCRDALRAIDAIEHDVRAGEEHAVREAIRLALVVADHISARVHEAVS